MFAFYDFETTGTSPAFDQPIQFAAILTDDDFNQIERIDIRCRLADHILPAPWAMAVTGVTPELLNDKSLPSWFEFTQQMADIIDRWAPATWAGFNSIAFDEEFFRQSFYQNLQPNLYLTQFSGNNRLDLMKVVFSTYVLAKETLQWPLNDKGNISFKLDQLAPANGFTQHDAHDALGDVEATIHIAKLIRDRAPEVWHDCLRNRDKHDVNALLETGKPLQLIERFGAAPPRSYIGCFAGRNPDNPNSVGFFDLQLSDPEAMADNDAMIAAAVSATPKLIRTVAVNKCPSLFEIDGVMPEMVHRAEFLTNNPQLRNSIGDALAGRYGDSDAPEHVELQMYSGFYTTSDKQLLEQLQHADWPGRLAIIKRLDDARLKRLGMRLVYLNVPELLSTEQCLKIKTAIHRRWVSNDQNAPWMTAAKVTDQLVDIETQGILTPDNLLMLQEFYNGQV